MSENGTKPDVIQLMENVSKEQQSTILAVGDPDEWQHQFQSLPQENLAFLAFREVTEAALEEFSPAVIISPVLAKGFDCIELTLLLRNLGYKGAYRALAQDMPKPALIEREVMQLYPDLNFKIELQA